jgi:hypothetical protein
MINKQEISMKPLRFLKLILLALVLAFFCASTLFAAYVSYLEALLIQPDKTHINAFQSGDEYHSWFHDIGFYTIVKDEKTGYFCWAILDKNDELTSSGYPIHKYTPASVGITPGINISDEKYYELMLEWQSLYDPSPSKLPNTGTINNLVIFILFAGEDNVFPNYANYYYPTFDALFIDDDPTNDPYTDATGTHHEIYSLYEHIRDSSHGQLHVNTLFKYPGTDSLLVYRSHLTRYEAFPRVNPITWIRLPAPELSLLQDAVSHIAPFIPDDFSVDHIIFIPRDGGLF